VLIALYLLFIAFAAAVDAEARWVGGIEGGIRHRSLLVSGEDGKEKVHQLEPADQPAESASYANGHQGRTVTLGSLVLAVEAGASPPRGIDADRIVGALPSLGSAVPELGRTRPGPSRLGIYRLREDLRLVIGGRVVPSGKRHGDADGA
jgi:hypothetical protein